MFGKLKEDASLVFNKCCLFSLIHFTELKLFLHGLLDRVLVGGERSNVTEQAKNYYDIIMPMYVTIQFPPKVQAINSFPGQIVGGEVQSVYQFFTFV